MKTKGPTVSAALLAAALVVTAATGTAVAATHSSTASSPVVVQPEVSGLQLAQDGGTEPRELQPRYEPAPPEPQGSYNNEYVFGLTRGVSESTMHVAAKVLLFPITIPLDLVFLPFSAIGGFF